MMAAKYLEHDIARDQTFDIIARNQALNALQIIHQVLWLPEMALITIAGSMQRCLVPICIEFSYSKISLGSTFA